MAKFRLAENVPEVYTNTSRDFQMMCNLFDAMNMGVKYDIDTIPTVTDTRFMRDSLLPLLKTTFGFNTNLEIPTEVLRIILISYPYFIKYKGCLRGIQEAALAFLKSQNIKGDVSVEVFNASTIEDRYSDRSDSIETYIVKLNLESAVVNIDILDEVFKYILPTGYLVRYVFDVRPSGLTTDIQYSDSVISKHSDLSINSVEQGTPSNTITSEISEAPAHQLRSVSEIV